MGDVPWGELIKVGVDFVKLLDSNSVQHMKQNVAAVPKGHESDFDGFEGWTSTPKQYPLRFYAEGLGTINGHEVASTDITIGITWRYGGRLQGTGRFIRDGDAFCTVENIPLGHSWTIDARWSDPIKLDNGLAQLYCDFTMTNERLTMHWFTWNYRIYIQGDGAAWFEKLG
jgi:hypothetical protein